MKIRPSHSTNSSIVAEGMRLQKAMKDTGREYLMLNRGVNSIVNIDLKSVIDAIDFNSSEIQVYPGTKGKLELRQAINSEYFGGLANVENILVTGGGISGLDICLQTLSFDQLLLPAFFWGTYTQICHIRKVPYNSYQSYAELFAAAPKLGGKAVIICDPGNPLGEKYPDELLISLVDELTKNGVVVLFDSPYRRLFYDNTDNFYQKLIAFENVIIIESFSKSVGLSGQRLGFMHSGNTRFTDEAALRLLYATNGVNAFAQMLVTKLLNTAEGMAAVAHFKKETARQIKMNIDFLIEYDLLAREFYTDTKPLGIFAVVKKSKQLLFENRIGSVGLDYFVINPFSGIDNYSRVLVSYPNEKFVSYFRNLL